MPLFYFIFSSVRDVLPVISGNLTLHKSYANPINSRKFKWTSFLGAFISALLLKLSVDNALETTLIPIYAPEFLNAWIT